MFCTSTTMSILFIKENLFFILYLLIDVLTLAVNAERLVRE